MRRPVNSMFESLAKSSTPVECSFNAGHNVRVIGNIGTVANGLDQSGDITSWACVSPSAKT